jgi:hypothetical protein
LRLQYLNNLDIRMEGIVVVSEPGRRLLDHVAAERRRVEEGGRARRWRTDEDAEGQTSSGVA